VVIDYGTNDFTVVHSVGTDAIHSLTSQASLLVNGGTLAVNDTSMVARDLTLYSTIAGTGDLTVAGELHVFNGTMSGSGNFTVAAGAVATIEGLYLSGRTLVNRGAATWLSGDIRLYSAATFHNEGTLDVRVTRNRFLISDDNTGQFVNTGSI